MEGYYNFQLTEKLRLSFHLQHVLETPAGGEQVRVPAAGRPAAGGVLGSVMSGADIMLSTARRFVLGALVAGVAVAVAAGVGLDAQRTSRSPTRRRSS